MGLACQIRLPPPRRPPLPLLHLDAAARSPTPPAAPLDAAARRLDARNTITVRLERRRRLLAGFALYLLSSLPADGRESARGTRGP